MYILQRMFGWGTETMRTSFEKSMKQFCDGICMKRYQMKDLKTSTVERITANEYRCDGKLWSHAKVRPSPALQYNINYLPFS